MNKKIKILLEAFIWLIILGGLITLGLGATKIKMDSRPKYEVVFRDIDSLQVGSPVRIMGIQVGHVIKIKPFYDSVKVDFVITRDNVVVPHSSEVRIQFTGLAGSKSIEILPNSNIIKNQKQFNVIEPVRISSLYEVMSSISESLLDSSRTSLDFLGKNNTEKIQTNIVEFRKASKCWKDKTIELDGSLENFSENYISHIRDTRTYLELNYDGFSSSLDFLNNNVSKDKMNNFTTKLKMFNESLDTKHDKVLTQFKNMAKNTDKIDINLVKYKNGAKFLNPEKYNFVESLEKIESGIKTENLDKVEVQVKEIKNFTSDLNKKLKED